LDNPVDPYLLQVQGSGTLLIQNELGVEERVIVNFSGENGWPYTSLGKLMRAAGVPDEYISLQGIKRYFIDVHPELWSKFSNQNQSYVFFKIANAGPFGAAATLLTPKHSIAVDPKVFPLGAIGLIQAERPFQVVGDQAQDWRPFSQFVVAQDTGGAIQSAGRVDVFWGEGHYAEVVAGQSDRMGELYFVLVPPSKKSGLRHP
jgi:membrane-bound lytic murein transglycosylase A